LYALSFMGKRNIFLTITIDGTTTEEALPYSLDLNTGSYCDYLKPDLYKEYFMKLSGRYNAETKTACLYESMKVRVGASLVYNPGGQVSPEINKRKDALYVICKRGDKKDEEFTLNDMEKIGHDILLGFFNMTDDDLVDNSFFSVSRIFSQ
jgi:hypothetical protein